MQKIEKISPNTAISALGKLTDPELLSLKFAMPWQMDVMEEGERGRDEDGFPTRKGLTEKDRKTLQKSCWEKFEESPFVGTSIRGTVGRLTGMGFEITSEIDEIQEAIDETELDPRNRLYSFWPKYVGRAFIEGELFQLLTVHTDGFVEVDFIEPLSVDGGGSEGIFYHPTKTILPLFYNIFDGSSSQLVPSIFVAYYPKELMKVARKLEGFKEELLSGSKNSNNKFNNIGGFNRFIVAWDRSFVTRRNVSYLRTILVWLNHYETLKKYEIDHKKSAGAYLWVVKIEDAKAFRTWLSLTDEERRKTGIMAKKTPGSMLVLPPGMTIEAINPKLPTITDTDTDILHLVTGGLNEPEDMATGQAKGTFASVKASRGPMSDRVSDEIAYFERYLRFDFYRSVFFLKTQVGVMKETYATEKAVDFKDNEPVFKTVQKKPEFLIEIAFPSSELSDAESRARAYLGVKHGSLYDYLGIPNAEISKKLGFANYRKMRLRQATEDKRYPKLEPPMDAGGQQVDPETGKPIAKPGAPKPKPGEPAKKVVKKPVK